MLQSQPQQKWWQGRRLLTMLCGATAVLCGVAAVLLLNQEIPIKQTPLSISLIIGAIVALVAMLVLSGDKPEANDS